MFYLVSLLVIRGHISFLKDKHVKVFLACFLIFVLGYMTIVTNLIEYIHGRIFPSNFIENEFVIISEDDVTFPDDKKNVIYIILESMENSYKDIHNGGVERVNLIPNLTNISKEHTSFGNMDEIYGTTWTASSLIAQTSGISNINGKNKNETFPEILSVGHIFQKNGYSNYIIFGSDKEFGGRGQYYSAQNKTKVLDVNFMLDNNYLSERVFWGANDKVTYEVVKDVISKEYSLGNNFYVSVLTVDTHFPNGYTCQDCNLIEGELPQKASIRCSDEQTFNFIKWVQEQPFADNTTIILVGDHLNMSRKYMREIESAVPNYNRTLYFSVINPYHKEKNTKERKFSAYDLYPTTLAAAGASIKGNRIGLGANLFSDEKTILEKYTKDYVTKELKKRSVFYNKKILNTNND